MRYLRSLYCETDLRTLAVLRIGLGLLLLFDLAKRIPGVGLWYVNSGLLPNHRVLWHPEPYQFSLLFGLWTVAQLRVAFVVFAVVYACFLVGYRTRLFHILSWLALLSLQTRANFLANGGDYVLGILLLWTTFMPLGARWSVDSQRSPGVDDSSFTSLSVLALRLQLCVIYVFNAINKTGQTWEEGSAVHYMLHQARIVTALREPRALFSGHDGLRTQSAAEGGLRVVGGAMGDLSRARRRRGTCIGTESPLRTLARTDSRDHRLLLDAVRDVSADQRERRAPWEPRPRAAVRVVRQLGRDDVQRVPEILHAVGLQADRVAFLSRP